MKFYKYMYELVSLYHPEMLHFLESQFLQKYFTQRAQKFTIGVNLYLLQQLLYVKLYDEKNEKINISEHCSVERKNNVMR